MSLTFVEFAEISRPDFASRPAYIIIAIEINKNLRKQNAALVTTELVLQKVADALCVPPLRQKFVNFRHFEQAGFIKLL